MSDSHPVEETRAVDLLDTPEAGGRFLRGGGLRVLAYTAGVGVALASTPFVVRHLGPVGWGRYVTVTALIFIVAAITEGGVVNLGVREWSTAGPAERRAYMRDLIGLRIALSLTGAAGALIFSLVAGYEPVLLKGVAIACIGLLTTNLQYTVSVPLTAGLRLGSLAATDLLAQTVTAVTMVLLVVAGAGLLPFFGVTAFATGVTLVVIAFLVRGELSLRPTFHAARWRRLIRESMVYAAATALGAVYFRVVVIAMSLIGSHKETGYFSLGFRVLDIVNAIPWLLVTSAFPILARAARDDSTRLRYATQRLFDGGMIVGGWFSICVVLGAPFAVKVIGGAKFDPSVPVLRILGAGIIATFLLAAWSFALLSLRLHRQLLRVNLLIVLAAVALCGVLIPLAGARGAAAATAGLEVLLAAGYAVALIRHDPTLGPSLRNVPRVAVALAAAFACGLIFVDHAVIAVAIASVVFAVVLFVLGAVPRELYPQALMRSGQADEPGG